MSSQKEGDHSSRVRAHNHAEEAKRDTVREFLGVITTVCTTHSDAKTNPRTGIVSVVIPVQDGASRISVKYLYDPKHKNLGKALVRLNGLDYKFEAANNGADVNKRVIDSRTRLVTPPDPLPRERTLDVIQFLRNPQGNICLLPFVVEPITPYELRMVGNRSPHMFVV